MRKTVIILSLTILAISILFAVVTITQDRYIKQLLSNDNSPDYSKVDKLSDNQEKCIVYKFNFEEWKEQITVSSKVVNVGDISDPFTAIEKAENLWLAELGDCEEFKVYQNAEKAVYFDPEYKYWLIHGKIPEDSFGAVPIAVIKSSGEVIAVCIS